jgi:signal transduction histidine kinase
MLSHLFVLLLPIAALIGTGALASDLWRQTQEDIDHQAILWRLTLEDALEEAPLLIDDKEIEAVIASYQKRMWRARKETLAGVRVVNRDGVVVVSATGIGLGEDVSEDKEVAAALLGIPGWEIRPRIRAQNERVIMDSKSRYANVRVYVAQPIRYQDRIVGAVLISRTPREEFQTLFQMAPQAGYGIGGAVLITISMAFLGGRRFARSVHALAETSLRIASGETDTEAALKPALQSHVVETRWLAEAMDTMRRRLQDRLRYISEFAANVSHEFKTPVTTLRGMIELLKEDEEMPPEQRARFLDNALADLERLSRMISGLLALARAEEGGHREKLELETLLQSAGATYSVPVSGYAAWIHGNRGQLETVLKNLLENALKHGGPPVELAGWALPDSTGFQVIDHGPGSSPANQGRIFDRFFTTARDQGGTGLGLALCRAVIQAHGGSIQLESRPGYTVFRISIPRA